MWDFPGPGRSNPCPLYQQADSYPLSLQGGLWAGFWNKLQVFKMIANNSYKNNNWYSICCSINYLDFLIYLWILELSIQILNPSACVNSQWLWDDTWKVQGSVCHGGSTPSLFVPVSGGCMCVCEWVCVCVHKRDSLSLMLFYQLRSCLIVHIAYGYLNMTIKTAFLSFWGS